MGAEAAVADADAVLGAEAGGDQGVGHAVDDERRDRQRRVVGAAGRAGGRPAIAASPCAQLRARGVVVVGGDRGPADALRARRSAACEGDRAEHVGRAGLLALGRVGPHDLVEVDEVDGAAAGEERVAVGRTRARGPMSTPAPNGAYILWPLHATKSAVGGQRSVRRELGGVDEDGHAAVVGGRR